MKISWCGWWLRLGVGLGVGAWAAGGLPAAPNVSEPLTLHVAPQAAAGGDGTAARPFSTLEEARDALRRERAGRSAVVVLAAGVYERRSTFELTAEDAATADAPVTYRAQPGASVFLRGGRTVPLSRFEVVTEPTLLDRLDPAARGQVRRLSMAAVGRPAQRPFPPVFHDHGGLFSLFHEGRRLPLSRWPNQGAATMGATLTTGDARTPGVFVFSGDRPRRWQGNDQIWLRGQWRVGWEEPAIRVARIDPEASTITFAAGIPLGIGSKYHRPGGSQKEPWWALNLVEEIDLPGEWAFDFARGELFLWPPEGASDQGEVFLTELEGPIVRSRGAAHVSWEGVTFELSQGDGVEVREAAGNHIRGCVIRRVSGRGLTIDGRESEVRSNDIYEVGAGAIAVVGGDLRRLEPSGIRVTNNHLHHYGQLKSQYSAAIHVGAWVEGGAGSTDRRSAVGVHVAHNLIHHAPRDAILVAGADHIFEFNEVHSCGYATADVGAIYSWLDWTIRGVAIRHNYFHRTVGGVNPDDGASGFLVTGNVFVGPRIGVWIASGPGHRVRHNIFVKERGAVFGMDDRGVSRGYATNARLLNRLRSVAPAEEPWRSRFPEVATMLENRPELPWGTEFVGNVVLTASTEPFQWKLKAEFRDNPRILLLRDNWITPDDPGFVDRARGDWRLRADSEVFRRIPDFAPIPFERIGLRLDEYRRRLPTAEEAGRLPSQNPFPDDPADTYFGT